MIPIQRVEGRAYPLGRNNIDTDMIIAADHLKTVTKEGLGRHAFETIRAEPGNVFSDPEFEAAPILIAGANFGCGSSREHAAWALADLGVRVVIAPSFSDIFSSNAFKNGIVTAMVAPPVVDRLMEVARTLPLSVDLDKMTIGTPFEDRFRFELDPFRRKCLMRGLDEIGLTLVSERSIDFYERDDACPAPSLLATSQPSFQTSR